MSSQKFDNASHEGTCREFSCNIDSILRNHSGNGLKILQLNLGSEDSTFPYVDSWLQVALTPGIEEINLILYKKYNFPCSLLSDGVRNSVRRLQLDSCVFRPTSELGPLRRLTNLDLSCVRITGDELECFLSNTLALEQLDLYSCKEIIFLKIPCVLWQLSCLNVLDCYSLQVIECNAPNLSSIDFSGGKIKLSLGQPLQMKKLHLCHLNAVCYDHAELPSIMPNLELLRSAKEVVNTPVLPTKFLYLKHLTIQIIDSYDYFCLMSFFYAAPSLETLFLELPEYRHDCLKSVKIIGFSSAKSLVELTCCIVKNTISLERVVLDTLRDIERCYGER